MYFFFTDVEVAKATEPVLSTLAQTTLGAISLVCVVVAVYAVGKLTSIQDKYADRLDAHNKQLTELYEKTTQSLSSIGVAVDALVRDHQAGREFQREQMNLLQQMKNAIDTTIRDAVLTRRSFSPGQGTPMPPQGGR